MPALTVRQRIELRLARRLSLLPPRLQVRLSGRPPVRLDGQVLEPEVQLMLTVIEKQGRPPVETLPPRQARRELRHSALVGAGPPVPVAAVRDLRVAGAAGELDARHYAPDEPGEGPHPLLVFLHGGGFVLGDLDTHDGLCRLLARHAGVHVLAVDYRLAPEAPFPAAVDDARAAFAWACEHAASLGADPARVALGGDSAGGNLSAVVAWQAAREGTPAPALQLLLYPATDLLERAPSHELFGEGFFLTRPQMDWFAEQYVQDAERTDPRISVLRAEDLSGLAPALVVTAGFDPLRDEGEAYASRLREAGVPVALRRFPGLVHGFCNMTGASRTSRDAVVEVAGSLRALLATSGARVAEEASA